MAGFFNTSWDLGNMFSSPSVGNQMIGGNLPTEITPRPGSEGPTDTASFINTWGAPTGYAGQTQQQGGMFNPYQATGGGFYNPYQFGQVQYGPQYGGGQEMPWWMNYNVNNPFMPTQPSTPSVQPEQQAPRGPQGTGPNGKDLTYDETIKYFGLYDDAESALAAGDSQAAYRKDHMQWRSGTGNYEGMGEGQGQYPGRPDLGIAGDAQRMTDLMGFPSAMVDKFKGLFAGSQNNEILNATPAIGGGSGFTQVPMTAGPFDYLQRGRNKYDINTLLSLEAAGKLPPNITRDYSSDVPDPFNQESNYNYTTLSPYTPRYPSPFNQESNYNYTTPSAYTPRYDDPNNISSNYEYFQDLGDAEPLIFSEPMTTKEQARNGANRSLFGIGKDNFVPETRYGPNNSRQLVESNLLGFPTPTPTENAYAQRRFRLMEQEREKQAAMAESKRAAEEYEAKNRAEAAAKAAADAAAAQKRKNDNYETGYVAPNRYTTKDVNNSFAARRDIRNIFA